MRRTGLKDLASKLTLERLVRFENPDVGAPLREKEAQHQARGEPAIVFCRS